MKNILKFIIAVGISLLAGIIGSIFTTSSVSEWYPTLLKPALNPPAWVFGPVWTLLYFLMGISAYIVWSKGLQRKDVRIAMSVFFIQLVLNSLWSIIFFGLRNPGAAFVEIVMLWLAIVATITSFRRVSSLAAWLLIPYILWVSFASYLNFSIWMLNS